MEQNAQKMDIWEELEFLHKEIKEEIELQWISNVEKLCDEIDDNFIFKAKTNKEPVSTLFDSTTQFRNISV